MFVFHVSEELEFSHTMSGYQLSVLLVIVAIFQPCHTIPLVMNSAIQVSNKWTQQVLLPKDVVVKLDCDTSAMTSTLFLAQRNPFM